MLFSPSGETNLILVAVLSLAVLHTHWESFPVGVENQRERERQIILPCCSQELWRPSDINLSVNLSVNPARGVGPGPCPPGGC